MRSPSLNLGGGVLDGNCGDTIDHAVLLIGYGTDAKHGDYWKLKNSWGTGWGERGFARLKRGGEGEGECGIRSEPLIVLLDGGEATQKHSFVFFGAILVFMFFIYHFGYHYFP